MKEILKKIYVNLKENKYIHYIIIIVIGIILSIPISKIQIRGTHDGALHFLRLLGTADTLKMGQFPPLINQNYCNGVRIFYEFILPSTCYIFAINYKIVYIKLFYSIKDICWYCNMCIWTNNVLFCL